MKVNKLTIILIIIILILGGIIIYDRWPKRYETKKNEETLTISDTIKLDYGTFYLMSDGKCYLKPITNEEIDNLNLTKNLSSRLKTLYERAFYQDIYVDNYLFKAFRMDLDYKVVKIKKIDTEYNTYIVFLKENNKIALFNYQDYYNTLEIKPIDNYQDINDVIDIQGNYLIFKDGSRELLFNELK